MKGIEVGGYFSSLIEKMRNGKLMKISEEVRLCRGPNFVVLSIGIVLSILLTGCFGEEYCDSVSHPGTSSGFTLLDSSGFSLIGEGRMYTLDSLNYYNPSWFFGYTLSTDSILEIACGHHSISDTLFFHLSSVDTDTLVLNCKVVESRCFTLNYIEQFIYNEELIQKQNGIYIVYK